MVFARGRDELLDVVEPVLKPPDVESVQQGSGDDLPAAFAAAFDGAASSSALAQCIETDTSGKLMQLVGLNPPVPVGNVIRLASGHEPGDVLSR